MMGRKNLGGSSSLRANHEEREYNNTLNHVYETALGNLDDNHKKRQRRKLPRIFSLCIKSAVDDVVQKDLETAAPELSSGSIGYPYPPIASQSSDSAEAVFLMRGRGIGSLGQHGRYWTVGRSMKRVAESMKKGFDNLTGGASDEPFIYEL
jgi:hypothetical protein